MPVTLSDPFTASNGTNLVTQYIGPGPHAWEQVVSGSKQNDLVTIQSNQAVCGFIPSGETYTYRCRRKITNPDYSVRTTFSVTTRMGNAFPAIRMPDVTYFSDTRGGYYIECNSSNGTNMVLNLYRSGSPRVLLDTVTTPHVTTGTFVCTITASGTSISARLQRLSDNYYLNGSGAWAAAVANMLDATDSTFTAGGFAGMTIGKSAVSTSGTIDLWEVLDGNLEPVSIIPEVAVGIAAANQLFEIALTGVNTPWISGVSDLTLSGVPGLTINSEYLADYTVGYLELEAGDYGGLLTISDGTNSTTVYVDGPPAPYIAYTATGTAVVPPAEPQSIFNSSSYASYPVTLGCANYKVWALTRRGESHVCQLQDVSRLEYNRVINDVSTATITVSMRGTCAPCMEILEPFAHEISIYRVSEGQDSEVWCGIITRISIDASRQTATIHCSDLSLMWEYRTLEFEGEDIDLEEVDLTDAFDFVLCRGYEKDPWNFTWSLNQVGIPVTKYYPAFVRADGDRWGGQYPVCADEMRSLYAAGMDFTVYCRRGIGGNFAVSSTAGSTALLLDKHLQESPNIEISGTTMGNRIIVAGGQGGYYGFSDDAIAMVPEITGPIRPNLLTGQQAKYGLIERFYVNPGYDEVDTTVAPNPLKQEAGSRYELLSKPYVLIKEVILNPDAPFPLDQLIPGTVLNVALEKVLRPLTEYSYRIGSVNVTLDKSGEQVRIELTPVGTQGVH